MKKISIFAAAFIAAGLAPHSGFAQDIGAAGQVAKGTTSGISLDRIVDAAGPAANSQTPPPGGSKAANPTATNTQLSGTSSTTTLPFPAFTPAEYKQAAKDIVLINAAFEGQTWNVRNAIAKGAKINSADWQYGFTPLMWAAMKGHLGTVRYLLKHGANPNLRSKEGMKIMLAYKYHEIIPGEQLGGGMQQFWARGSSASADRGAVTALMLAAAHGYNLTVSELLANKAETNLASPSGETALMFGAFSGHLPTIKSLLAHGAKLNAIDGTNATALNYAIINREKPAARLLLSKKIRTDLVDPRTNMTTAEFARAYGLRDIAWSIDKGVKPKKKAAVEKTPVATGDNVVILN